MFLIWFDIFSYAARTRVIRHLDKISITKAEIERDNPMPRMRKAAARSVNVRDRILVSGG